MHLNIFQNEHLKSAQQKFLLNLPFWISAILTALVSVFYTRVFKLSEDWAFSQASTFWIYVTAPLGMLLSFLIGHYFSKEAIGSGIPQVIAAVDLATEQHPYLQKLLSLRMLVAKIVGSCVCVMGGGVSGREGPTLHVSTAIFYQVARFWPKKMPQVSLPGMMLAGGAAGLASAFNTPLGGVVFAIEELSKTHISHVRTAVFQAVIIAGFIAQMLLGNYLYLGAVEFGTFPVRVFFQTILVAAIVGVVSGVFAESLYRLGNWRAKKSFAMKVAMTLFCGGLLSLTIYLCGAHTIGAGKHVIVELLQNPNSHADPLLSVGRIFGNFFTYTGGVIGGVFAPALASGAALGQLISQTFGFPNVRLLIMVGMVAFLTGITRTPFTSSILVLEMSDSHDVILYLMLSSLVANFTARAFAAKGFYEQAAHGILTAQARGKVSDPSA